MTSLQYAKIVLLADLFQKPENWIRWYNRKLRDTLFAHVRTKLKIFKNYPTNFPWGVMVTQKCEALNKLLRNRTFNE